MALPPHVTRGAARALIAVTAGTAGYVTASVAGAPGTRVASAVAAAALAAVAGCLVASWRGSATAPGNDFTVERRLLGLLSSYKRTVAAGIAVTVGLSLTGLARPWPTKILVDDVLTAPGGGSSSALLVVVGFTMALFFLGAALRLLQTVLLHGLTQRVIGDLRSQLFNRLTRMSLRFHDERGVGDMAYRVSADTYALHGVLLGGVVPVVSAVLTLVGALLLMLQLDVMLAVVTLTTVPLATLVSRRWGTRIRSTSTSVHEVESDVWTHAEQTLSGIRTVQAFARERYEGERFLARVEQSKEAMQKLVTQQTLFSLAVDAILAVGIAAVMWLAAKRALSGDLTPGEVLVFLAYAGTLYGPVAELAGVFGEVQSAVAGGQRVFEVLDEGALPKEGTETLEQVRGELAFDRVHFGYGDRVVIHDVDFSVGAGEVVALVGPTGAGKSTLLSLLLRLYDPTSGRVTLDGKDLRSFRIEWLREQIAFVPQDPILFPVSVRENIRYGRLDATDEEVEQAAARANILDELLEDPRGLDAPVGDRGVTLSGGQRQRVAIARAFLKNAPIVALDEPTSALDARTESLAMDALWRLLEGRTCVVIAHRLATVHRAGRIIVIDRGRVVQQGSHRELIRRSGLYRELHRSRFGAEATGLAGAGAGATGPGRTGAAG